MIPLTQVGNVSDAPPSDAPSGDGGVLHEDRSLARLLWLAGIAYVLYLVYLEVGLGFEMLQLDSLSYWEKSLEWRTPYDPWWVPGYPLVIAAVRAITFNILPLSSLFIQL